jgi:hypothetical protein
MYFQKKDFLIYNWKSFNKNDREKGRNRFIWSFELEIIFVNLFGLTSCLVQDKLYKTDTYHKNE